MRAGRLRTAASIDQKNMQKVQRELAEGKPDLLRAGGWLSVESMTLLMLHLTTP